VILLVPDRADNLVLVGMKRGKTILPAMMRILQAIFPTLERVRHVANNHPQSRNHSTRPQIAQIRKATSATPSMGEVSGDIGRDSCADEASVAPTTAIDIAAIPTIRKRAVCEFNVTSLVTLSIAGHLW
jgi:hypothetical protein